MTSQWPNGLLARNYSQNHEELQLPRTSDALLVASVNGQSVGGGPGVLYSAINGNVSQNQRFGNPSKVGVSKVNSNDPQVRKLVYNMYRGLLSTKHERANNIVEAAPQEKVQTDGGVGERVLSMLRQQSELKEGKMMNLGPPPPPPPPPFSTGEPTPAPAPRPSAMEIPSKPQPPTIAPPAALAGAMMKDKKPFTYTPGGFNLAEINAQIPAPPPPQQNGTAPIAHFGGVSGNPAMQSKSFRVLQNVYDTQDFAGEMTGQEVQPEPKKYTGSSIPSRSFRMLQAMTDTEDDNTNGLDDKGKQWTDESRGPTTQADNFPKFPKRNNHQISPSSTSSIVFAPSVSMNSNNKDIGSGVAPSYTSTGDSHVYRQVVPTIVSNGNDDRIVNTALCVKRDSSPRPWHNSSREASPSVTAAVSSLSIKNRDSPTPEMESPSRLLNIIRQETSEPGNDTNERKLYEGGHIPSRVFRQLQSDYSGIENCDPIHSRSTTPSNRIHSGRESCDPIHSRSTTPSNRIIEVQIPRIIQQLNNDDHRKTNCTEEQNRNGVLQTASAKESVLKELTTQFDPETNLKKPRAAPGRVFRYLQQQYDDPQDSDFASLETDSNNRSSNASPSLRSVSPNSANDSGHYEAEVKSQGGLRVPGRTFRMLQENIDTHPSVFEARK